MRPDLGYFDEGANLEDPALYGPARARFGAARILTPIAFRSKVFADLEDETIWTRSWVCIGSHREIPNVGDLLPYTVGNHGVHVQRGPDGLVGRFNLAQHGGCRAVPAQCRTGTKTKCSFTSCGYSRDRDAIRADEIGADTPAMRQYLGFRPDRLFPVAVASWGPLLFVNLDREAESFPRRQGRTAPAVRLEEAAGWDEEAGFRADYASNWKLLAHALVRRFSPGGGAGAGVSHAVVARLKAEPVTGEPATLCWLFPNLVVLRWRARLASVVFQPTGISETQARVRVANEAPVDPAFAAAWRAVLDEAGDAAAARQGALERFGTPSRPETSLDDLPAAEDRAAHAFQKYLIARVLKKRAYHGAGPLYSAPAC